MGDCCNNSCAADALRETQKGTLQIVLGINASLFVIIVIAAYFAQSTALYADSLDDLGDSLTYGLSLLFVAGTALQKAKVALFKGLLILIAACLVSLQIGYKLINPSIPIFETMGLFSVISLIANSICLLLLWRHRNEDINMSSVWECSRNDIASNLSVLIAAGAVALSGSGWPDIIIATALVVLLLRSSARVIASARKEINLELTTQSAETSA